ncbi:MAG: hypothetical protein WC812_01960 [Candidatus Pacearchaeota archaeon]|jgi:hypothetical protein
MIEKFKQFRFEFDKQKEEYFKIKDDITKEEKYVLLDEINQESIWNYFQLSVEVLFDLVSDDEKYLSYLEKVFLKIKGDMASGPFFEMLIKVGKEKQEIAIRLYDLIRDKSDNIDLKIISGRILGGYAFHDETSLKELIKKDSDYPMRNTILKAILVRYEKEILPLEIKSYLDKTELFSDERILTELMGLYLCLYKNEKYYFYNKIKLLAKRKISSVNRLLFWMTVGIKLEKEHILELIELCKDSDGEIVRDMMYPLIDYPDEIEKISKLFIYWINKDLEFKVQHFDWAIQELVKKNEKFIDYFLDNFEKVKTENFPRIFEKMASQNVESASRELMEKKIFDKDPKLYYELVSKIIGIIYKDSDNNKAFDLFLPLAQKIESIAETKDFINENKSSFNDFVGNKNFYKLIDYTDELLEQLIYRNHVIAELNFDEINKSLNEFPELDKIIKHKLKELYDKKRYSPLFWLGNWKRDKELKESYLNEFEDFLKNSKDILNKRNNDDNTKTLLDSLEYEERFWDNFSEVIFSNRFLPQKQYFEMILEPQIPNKINYADLSIKLNKKDIFFEVKNSDGDRSLHLDNGAVTIKNKLNNILSNKSGQFYSTKTFEEMEKGTRKDLFFIVVDISSSVIDKYMIADSFFGTLAYQFYRNNKTGETTEGEWIRQPNPLVKNKKVVSGLIYFKRQLIKDPQGKIKFILVGDIILNPYAVNQPNEEEVKKLKEIIFEKN